MCDDREFYDATLAGNKRIEEVIHLFHTHQTPVVFIESVWGDSA